MGRHRSQQLQTDPYVAALSSSFLSTTLVFVSSIRIPASTMQLGSAGTRAFRQASHIHARGIHIPATAPRPATTKPISSAVETVFKRTRTLLTSFLSHLTTPGAIGRTAQIPTAGRSLYPPPTHARPRPIQSGLRTTCHVFSTRERRTYQETERRTLSEHCTSRLDRAFPDALLHAPPIPYLGRIRWHSASAVYGSLLVQTA